MLRGDAVYTRGVVFFQVRVHRHEYMNQPKFRLHPGSKLMYPSSLQILRIQSSRVVRR